MNVGQELRAPIHQDRGAGRRASALRATDALRRRRAARQRHDANARHVGSMAEKFHARAQMADRWPRPQILPPPAFDHPAIAAPTQRYVVLYFALAIMSVLAAAQAHTGGLRAHPWLIAMTPQMIPRAVTEPQRTSLRETSVQDITVLAAAHPPPLAGLAALRETIQSRHVDIWPELGPGPAEQADGPGAAAPAAVIDDEFGSGLRAPGICELLDASGNGLHGTQVHGTQAIASEAQVLPDQASNAGTSQAQISSEMVLNIPASQSEFGVALAAAAQRQTANFTVYTDKYRRMSYPMGDVPALFGVCTDVVIRAYRALGVDLQALIHIARIGPADASIAHRRTFTLRRYFASRGASMPITEFAEDYSPGDIVTYHRPQNRGSRDHIAIVSNLIAPSGRPMIVHNRGWGPQIEDALFVDKITGHYRYRGASLNGSDGATSELGSSAGAKTGKPQQRPRAAEVRSQAKSRGPKAELPALRR